MMFAIYLKYLIVYDGQNFTDTPSNYYRGVTEFPNADKNSSSDDDL